MKPSARLARSGPETHAPFESFDGLAASRSGEHLLSVLVNKATEGAGEGAEAAEELIMRLARRLPEPPA
jgi:hypothetical protein